MEPYLFVRNAQGAGASAVVIADNKCLCKDLECMNITGSSTKDCEEVEPIMADDGSGLDVSIPSFLLFKHDADAIRSSLLSNQMVTVEMKFSVPAPDSHVEYELWTQPYDLIARDFVKSFEKAAAALGNHASFTPHEYVIDGFSMGCGNGNICQDLCTNGGRYCSIDPDQQLYAGTSGADMVRESLRRLCVWQVHGKDGVGEKWWAYVNAFTEACEKTGDYSEFDKETCIDAALQKGGINKAAVDKCMTDTGDLATGDMNELFDEELKEVKKNGVNLVPLMLVNGAPLRGALELPVAFKAICAGYAGGSEPEICLKCASCGHDIEKCIAQGSCDGSGGIENGTVSLPVFGGISLLLILSFLVGGYIMHVRQRSAMQLEIRSIMAQYAPVDANRPVGTLGLDEVDESEAEFTIT